MVVQSLAEARFNPEKEEVTVLSKHSFSGQRKKIIGAVSVIFIQNENNSAITDKSNIALKPEERLPVKIPTSLSVIYLPRFDDLFTCDPTGSDVSDATSIIQGNLDESLSNLVTKTFVKNLDSVSEENNGKQTRQEILSENNEETCPISQEQTVSIDVKEHISECLKCSSKQMVDVSTYTEVVDECTSNVSNSKQYVNNETNTDTEDEPRVPLTNTDTEDEPRVPLNKKRKQDNDSKEFSMYIITENKSSSEDDSVSEDSVEMEIYENDNREKDKYKSSDSKVEPELPVGQTKVMDSNDVLVIQESSNSKPVDEGFGNSKDVSVVDLSNVPVSYANAPSQFKETAKTVPHQQRGSTDFKDITRLFGNHNESNTQSISHEEQHSNFTQSVSGQRPKFFRAVSLSKGGNKHTIDKCKICKRTVASLADMFHHSKIHNIGIKCCVCGMKAFDWSVMKHHYTWHIQRTAYRCPQCSTTFGSRDLLAAHMKTHTAAKSIVHLKNYKLRPPASRLIVSQATQLHKLSSLTASSSSMPSNISSSNTSETSLGRRKFTPFRQHLSPKYSYHSDDGHSNDQSHDQNVNQILNYSCGCCDEKFVNVEKLKRHVLVFHSEQTMSGSSYPSEPHTVTSYSKVSTSDFSENSSSSTAAISYPPENSGMINVKQEVPEIIDIEQLSTFTKHLENSMSTSSNEKCFKGINQTPDQFEQEVLSSFMDNSSEKQSPSSRQRKTACRLANVIPVCRICGIYLNSWSEILEHRFSHPEEIGQQLACTVCSSVLSTRDSLKRHAINHMGIRHQCQFCHHEYSRKDSLMNHMRSVHGYSAT